MPTPRELAARYSIADRTVRRLNCRGRECGQAPPWEDARRLYEWWLAWHKNPPPAWLQRAREQAEALSPTPEPRAQLRRVTSDAAPLSEPAAVFPFPSLDEGEKRHTDAAAVAEPSDIETARRIVAARQRELAQCEALPLHYEGRAGQLRNAQEAFFKAQEQLRRMQDHEDRARALAEEMLAQAQPTVAALVRRWCDRVRTHFAARLDEEQRDAAEAGLAPLLAEFHDELRTIEL